MRASAALVRHPSELGRHGVQREVITVYESVGCVVVRTGQSYRRGGRRNPGTPGIPDLYVFPPVRWHRPDGTVSAYPYKYGQRNSGAPFWHECKVEGGPIRPEQLVWRARCADHGVVCIVGGPAEAVLHLRAIGLVA